MNLRTLLFAAATALSFAAQATASTTVNISLTVTETFDLPATFLGEVFSGTVTYDDSLLTGLGTELLFEGDGSFSITAFGQVFTEADSAFAGFGFPLMEFFNGELKFLDFVVQEDDLLGTGITTTINEPLVKILGSLDELTQVTTGNYVGIAGVAATLPAIPLPATLPMAAAGVGALAFLRRKTSALSV